MTAGISKTDRRRFKKGDVFIDQHQHRQTDLVNPPIQLIIGQPTYHEFTKFVPRWECNVVWLTDGKYNFYRHKFFFNDADLQGSNIILLGETPETIEPRTHWEQVFTVNTTNTSNISNYAMSYSVSTTASTPTKWTWNIKKT